MAVGAVLTLLGAVLLVAMLLLADSRTKLVVIVSSLAGIMISASGFAEFIRDLIVEMITNWS